MSRIRTRWLAIAIAGIITATIGALALPALAEPGTGTLSGHLVDGSNPVEGAVVDLYDLESISVGQTSTDASGAFEFTGVAVGDYKVSFTIAGSFTQFVPQVLTFDAASVLSIADGATTAVEESVLPHGAIAGRVTFSDGSPVTNPQVSADAIDGSFAISTNGATDGTYLLPVVLPGAYVVRFQYANSPTQFANGHRLQADADQISVTAGETTTLDQTFLPVSTISGTFTDAGNPVAGATVQAQDIDTFVASSASTDSSGHYQLGVWPGTHVVSFNRPDGLTQYAHQKLTFAEADHFTVGEDQAIVVDEEMIGTGTIAGRLTDAAGDPVSGANVSATDDISFLSATTDGDGHYEMRALPGTYRVSFGAGHGTQWAFGRSSPGAADPIAVVTGQTTVVDDSFRPAGSIIVTANDATTGAAISSFCVFVSQIEGFPCTDSGSVTLSDVLPGRYLVSAYPSDESYYPGEVSGVIVTGGVTTNVTARPERTGIVQTSILDAQTGAPVADACLELVEPLRPTTLGATAEFCADETGAVTIDRVRAGTYNLFAWSHDSGHGHQWVGANGGTGAQAKARKVTVAPGQTVTLTPVRMDAAGTITGIITDKATGAPLANATASLSSWNDGEGSQALHDTDATGRYTWSGLGPYDWVLFFRKYDHAAVFSGNTSNRFLAKGIRVRVGRTTAYDQVLGTGVKVSVQVLGPNGELVSFARITVTNALTGDHMGSGDCAGHVRCDIPTFAPQAIKLHYFVNIRGDQYDGYLGSPDFETATTFLISGQGTKNVTLTADQLSP